MTLENFATVSRKPLVQERAEEASDSLTAGGGRLPWEAGKLVDSESGIADALSHFQPRLSVRGAAGGAHSVGERTSLPRRCSMHVNRLLQARTRARFRAWGQVLGTGSRRASVGLAPGEATKKAICWPFVKPSDGLEPSSPSLP